MSQQNDVPPDPLYAKSLSWPILIASLAVLLSVVLAVWDEGVRRRPYKAYQEQFKELYGAHLEKLKDTQTNAETVLEGLDEYGALNDAVITATNDNAAAIAAASAEAAGIGRELRSLNGALKVPKAAIAAQNYLAEHHATDAGNNDIQNAPEAKSYLAEIEKLRDQQVTYEWSDAAEQQQSRTGTVRELFRRAAELQTEKAAAQSGVAAANEPVGAAKRAAEAWRQRNFANLKVFVENLPDNSPERERIGKKVAAVGAKVYLDRHTTTITSTGIADLIRKNDDMLTGVVLGGQVHEIFIRDANNWVDRCTTCHMGSLSPVPLNAEDMGGNQLFASHPRTELLAVHPTEKFGCSMCHNGNGVAITTTEYAHGLDEFWLHKLHPKENIEAGCVQCHDADLVLPMGERITAGKETFLRYGCWGCHERENYNLEPNRIRSIGQRLREIDISIGGKSTRAESLAGVTDPVFDVDSDAADRITVSVKQQQVELQLEISGLETERNELLHESADLYRQKAKVGPMLKELRIKTTPEWLFAWLRDQHAFRPDTKMPRFRLFKGEVDGTQVDEFREATAFLWQAALDPAAFPALKLPAQSRGDAAKGETLFKTQGCVACHGMGEGDERIGSDFAATLNNLGEKLDFQWTVRWLLNPGRRLVPYDASLGRDVSAAERRTLGIADDDLNLVWSTHSAMPSLRLKDQEARDLATYLLSQKRPATETDYQPAADWVNDAALAERGKKVVSRLGCAGCHEIAGLENEKGVGVALTTWASRPIELLDFGHYLHHAHRGHDPLAERSDLVADNGKKLFEDGNWHTHLEFEKHKIAQPDLYEEGKNTEDPANALRMPKFPFTGQQVLDVATFVVGGVESKIPSTYRYTPDERQRAIQKGWWVVRKYNCQGCHDITPEQGAHLPAIAAKVLGEEQRMDALPPSLVGTGYRTQPAWLAHFLGDPALGGGTEKPRAARLHLTWRMPTFNFSADEIRTLVAFFDALANQKPGYVPPPFVPLTAQERPIAEAIFTEAKCTQCHVVDGMALTSETKAPNFSLASARLRPEWMRRWIREPQLMQPGTAMLKLFNEEGGRWTYQDPAKIPGHAGYSGDHIDLMIRYLRSLDAAR